MFNNFTYIQAIYVSLLVNLYHSLLLIYQQQSTPKFWVSECLKHVKRIHQVVFRHEPYKPVSKKLHGITHETNQYVRRQVQLLQGRYNMTNNEKLCSHDSTILVVQFTVYIPPFGRHLRNSCVIKATPIHNINGKCHIMRTESCSICLFSRLIKFLSYEQLLITLGRITTLWTNQFQENPGTCLF